MSYRVGFTYSAMGQIELEADNQEEAEEKAQEVLDDLQMTGSIMTANNIIWDNDEVEVI